MINRNKSDFTRSYYKEYIGDVIDIDGPGGVPLLYIPNIGVVVPVYIHLAPSR